MKREALDALEFLMLQRRIYVGLVRWIQDTEVYCFKLLNVLLLRQDWIYQKTSSEQTVKRISSQLRLQPLHSELCQNLLVYMQSSEFVKKFVVINLDETLKIFFNQRRLYATIYEIKDVRGDGGISNYLIIYHLQIDYPTVVVMQKE